MKLFRFKLAIYFLLALAVPVAFTLNDLSFTSKPSDGDTIYIDSVFVPMDTTRARINQLNDSLENRFVRFSDIEDGDSTFDRLQADTVVADTIDVAHVDADTVFVDTITATKAQIDSLLQNTYTDTLTIDFIRGNPSADSLTLADVDINGGAIDGTVIGAASAAAGSFTTMDASGAATATTLNTGQGANELYDMDQNVLTTSDVTFDSIDVATATADTLLVTRASAEHVRLDNTQSISWDIDASDSVTVTPTTSLVEITRSGVNNNASSVIIMNNGSLPVGTFIVVCTNGPKVLGTLNILTEDGYYLYNTIAAGDGQWCFSFVKTSSGSWRIISAATTHYNT